MKDLYEVLRRKELDLARLRVEIQALRGVIPLLEDENQWGQEAKDWPSPSSLQRNRWPLDLSGADRKSGGPDPHSS